MIRMALEQSFVTWVCLVLKDFAKFFIFFITSNLTVHGCSSRLGPCLVHPEIQKVFKILLNFTTYA